jgi:hypothetical protein
MAQRKGQRWFFANARIFCVFGVNCHKTVTFLSGVSG